MDKKLDVGNEKQKHKHNDYKESVNNINKHSSFVNCLINFNYNEKTLIASGSDDATIKIWETDEKNKLKLIYTLVGHEDCVNTLCFIFNTSQLISGGDDFKILIWDINNGKLIKKFEGHEASVLCLTNIPDEKLLISGGDDFKLKIWNESTGKLLKAFMAHDAGVMCSVLISEKTSYYKENTLFATGSDDKTIKIWDSKSDYPIKTLRGHEQVITCMIYCESGLISGSYDKTIIIWNIEKCERIKVIQSHQSSVWGLAILDLNYFVSTSDDLKIKVYELIENKECKEIQTIKGHSDCITCVTCFKIKDKFYILSGSLDSTLRVWESS